jgi:hypothetical protein
MLTAPEAHIGIKACHSETSQRDRDAVDDIRPADKVAGLKLRIIEFDLPCVVGTRRAPG